MIRRSLRAAACLTAGGCVLAAGLTPLAAGALTVLALDLALAPMMAAGLALGALATRDTTTTRARRYPAGE